MYVEGADFDSGILAMVFLHLSARLSHPLVIIGMTAVVLCVAAPEATAQVGTGTFRVDGATGTDSAGCGSALRPCKRIQQAVNLAAGNDTILVAEGTYTYELALDPCATDHTAVVCIWEKPLTLLGGYGQGAWTSPNPTAHPTLISGGNSQRCVRIAESNVRLEGFTLTEGLATPKNGDDNAFGGGLSAVFSDVVLRDVIFSNNVSRGRNTASGSGGSGAGGGLSVKGDIATQGSVVLERAVFENNTAEGGSGPDSGGFAVGGAMFVNYSNATGVQLDFQGNLALAGSSPGNGSVQGVKADGLGGGVAFMKGSVAVIQNVTATGNATIGGDATTSAGSGYGAAIYGEETDLTVVDAQLSGNTSTGGIAATGGRGVGGALMTLASDVSLERVAMTDNSVQGGDGSVQPGAGGGGGAYFEDRDASKSVSLVNCIVADNSVSIGGGGGSIAGGGGGGLFFLGAQAEVSHTTIAGNSIEANLLQGRGMFLVTRLGTAPSNVDFSFGIIADHSTSGGDAAIRVKPDSVLNLDVGMFANNGTDYLGDGTITGAGSMLNETVVAFVSPGAPNHDYHLQDTSPAIGEALGSVTVLDIDGGYRDAEPDLGADEYGASAPAIFTDGFESGDTSEWSSAS